MGNLLRNGDFSQFVQTIGSAGTISFVDADKRHISVSNSSGSTLLSHDSGWVSYGQVYEFKVLGKVISGKPRIWFRSYNESGTQLNNPNYEYAELDLENDWKLYTIRYKVNNPAIKRINANVGFWFGVVGEVEFKDPHMCIVSEDYDANVFTPRIIACGNVGWNGSEWDVYSGGVNHGIGSLSWNTTSKVLTVNLSRTYGANPVSKYPFASVSGYLRGQTNYPAYGMVTPVIKSTFGDKVEIVFLGNDNNPIDITTSTNYCYTNLLVFI